MLRSTPAQSMSRRDRDRELGDLLFVLLVVQGMLRLVSAVTTAIWALVLGGAPPVLLLAVVTLAHSLALFVLAFRAAGGLRHHRLMRRLLVILEAATLGSAGLGAVFGLLIGAVTPVQASFSFIDLVTAIILPGAVLILIRALPGGRAGRVGLPASDDAGSPGG